VQAISDVSAIPASVMLDGEIGGAAMSSGPLPSSVAMPPPPATGATRSAQALQSYLGFDSPPLDSAPLPITGAGVEMGEMLALVREVECSALSRERSVVVLTHGSASRFTVHVNVLGMITPASVRSPTRTLIPLYLPPTACTDRTVVRFAIVFGACARAMLLTFAS
jgi:hypothetical protein